MILYCKITTPKSVAKIVFDGSKCIKAEVPLQHMMNKSFYEFTKLVREYGWNYLISSKEFGQYNETLEGKTPEEYSSAEA